MTKFDVPKNANYVATIVAVPEPVDLPGLDNLVGIPQFGYQALTTRGISKGDLRVLFTAETQLSAEYVYENSLSRDKELNKSDETGYIERHRRIRAIKLRKHQSDALLMPLESLAYTGYDVSTLKPGDVFDTLNGFEICRKYELPKQAQPKASGPKIRQRVDQKLFPMHLDTEHLFRNWDVFRESKWAVITQKLHGTSIRIGRVPALRDKGWLERVVVNKWLRIPTADTAYEDVAGSRRVIKGRDDNNHYYESDIWAEYAKRLEGMIPENFVVYGELIGWESKDKPIQRGYTYDLEPGERELYVYRVAMVNGQGVIADLSWDGVEQFCASIGLKTVPVLCRPCIDTGYGTDDRDMTALYASSYLNIQFAGGPFWEQTPVPLSDPKTVDEGICVRIEGRVPQIFKAKSPLFLEHETKSLDAGELDLESAA
ncbi:RNA ligase family protein [Mycobacteroides abscessus]|uniref:RNA ligase family protein n=1 Tax=Mycobacteroides abscessus TaxID=36809 RepID=UPI000303FD2D|nr:RNA ligase family protein [Mycobacteroides abscessus]